MAALAVLQRRRLQPVAGRHPPGPSKQPALRQAQQRPRLRRPRLQLQLLHLARVLLQQLAVLERRQQQGQQQAWMLRLQQRLRPSSGAG